MSKRPRLLNPAKFKEDQHHNNIEDRSEDYEDVNTPQQQLLDGDDALEHIDLNDEEEDEHKGRENGQEHQQPKSLYEFLHRLDEENNSEDQGIEDYKIGGYHPCLIGQVLLNRYVLIQKLGWGHFSTVWLAKDFKYNNYVAVKIMKSAPHYIEAAYDEVEILQKVAKNVQNPQWIQSVKRYKDADAKFDRDDTHVVQLLNSFLFQGPYGNHFCMVFEILGVNLLEVLKRYEYKGVPLNLARQISRQVLIGLDFLHRICKVIHTDLKPENVLLCLTEDQIKQIIEKGQLTSNEIYLKRLNLYRKMFMLGPYEPEADQHIETESELLLKELKEKMRLEHNTLSAGQRKNLRKRIKKLQKKIETEPKKKSEASFDKLCITKNKLIFDKGPKLEKGFKVKIADLGNACWTHHHFATEIQTRQYRGPQVLVGAMYNTTADIWSFACMTFEMMTGELLFNPRKDKNETYGKNDDHVAQMMELLGKFPTKFSLRGRKSSKYFDKKGNLKRIQKLQQWPIKDVMMAKYKYVDSEAEAFQRFMEPMLVCYPEKRITAQQMLNSPWLKMVTRDDELHMNDQEFDRLRKEKFQVETIEHDEVWQYETENEDAGDSNNQQDNLSNDSEFYNHKRMGELRFIDRSFTDLGYIGYGEGIYLEQLDTVPNWQFSI